MENFFESLLWKSRLVLIVAVVCCLATAFSLIGLGAYEVIHFIGNLVTYFIGGNENITRDVLVLSVIEVLDTFLISSILFIFSFGLYELFISSIDETGKHTSQAFQINSIDQLKTKLGNVIVMLLVIKVFAYLIELRPSSIIETLYLAIIVLLVSISLWLGHAHKK
ncbi:MAG: putative membrane protein YqhA [Colwellia sp.]|jgi:uncharacterized membrane protein YqhA|uniref:YqhA family protein n=1 Tax=Colwellia sp. MB02u-14 TaxID=2759815 RepID=UPI0015F6D7E2|nr:YqhA family protein [Colwellia sp. MB02u-14]MBA6303299.1 YqhA family protein [Colwellia sp. MB02u-14]